MTNGFDNPLIDPEEEHSNTLQVEDVEDSTARHLPELPRGRMFCLVHAQHCYQKFSIFGESFWVCPDERHGKPLGTSTKN